MNSPRMSRLRLGEYVTGLLQRLRSSVFVRNASWLTGITGIERGAGLVQTVLLARVLGITEYGVYGLLFSTVGFVASVMGLQMGLTATVFVARYREHDKANAGAVIRYVMRFAFIVGGGFLILSLPFAPSLSQWLLQSENYHFAIVMGCLFVAASLLSGVQDGIVEGFEDFRGVAIARLVGAVFTLAAIYPAVTYYGLDGALIVLLAGVLIKYAILVVVATRHRRQDGIPRRGGTIRFLRLVKDFSLPSMLVSLLLGAVMWYGMYLLSRLPAGFAAVAVVSVGLQWRGPILLITGALGRVAVPTFSRHAGGGNQDASRRFKRKLMWLNGLATTTIVFTLIAGADLILSLYGEGFQHGWPVFALLLLAVIPQVLADVHMQDLIGSLKMWRLLAINLPMLFVALAGFVILIPTLGGLGYAGSIVGAACVFLLSAWVWPPARRKSAVVP